MKALLWVLSFVALSHLLALICAYYGQKPLTPKTPTIAALRMAYTLGIGAWAVWLIAAAGV